MVKDKFLIKIRNSFIIQLLICFILCSIVIGTFLIVNKYINQKNSRKYTLIEDVKFINLIEKIYTDNKNVNIEGYAFLLEQDSKNASISIFLHNPNRNKDIWLNTETVSRSDVQKLFYSDFNYENTGFIASINKKKLNMNDVYEIIINIDLVDDNGMKYRKTFSSSRYIYKGELLSYNPLNIDYPNKNISSNLLREVFDKGKLYFCNKAIGLYIYEYQNKMYWVATKDFMFSSDGKTYIPYQLWTHQIEKLPEHRIQYGFDNLDFYFEDNEIITENTDPYRVAVQDIPNKYYITYIKTGVYDNYEKKWLWNKLINIDN